MAERGRLPMLGSIWLRRVSGKPEPGRPACRIPTLGISCAFRAAGAVVLCRCLGIPPERRLCTVGCVRERGKRTVVTSTHQTTFHTIVITAAHAYFQMAAAAHVLLEREPVWTEGLLLKLVQALYEHRLHGLLELLPEDMVAEIVGEENGEFELTTSLDLVVLD
jgi:hypothetical protein